MSLYFDILYNISNLNINIFSYENNYIKDIDICVQASFKYYFDNRNFYKNKYDFLNKNYIENPFMKKMDKNDLFLTFFSKINKTYITLNKLLYNYKYKKSKIVVDTDLCLNKIQIDSKNTISILQENKKYLFRLEELVSIIHTALTNAPGLFCEPLLIKNPYNNIPFNKSTLYNIYFSILFKTNIHSDLFFKFFKLNFDLSRFFYEYEYLLKEYAIENFIKNSTVNSLWIHVMDMIEDYNFENIKNGCSNRIKIDTLFPKKNLVKIMMPYLKLYMISVYSLINIKKIEAKRILYKKLKRFNTYNTLFGKKKVKYINGDNNEMILSYDFNDNHIKFEDVSTEVFLNSHMNNDIYENNHDHLQNEVIGNEFLGNTIILNFIQSTIDSQNTSIYDEETEGDTNTNTNTINEIITNQDNSLN